MDGVEDGVAIQLLHRTNVDVVIVADAHLAEIDGTIRDGDGSILDKLKCRHVGSLTSRSTTRGTAFSYTASTSLKGIRTP